MSYWKNKKDKSALERLNYPSLYDHYSSMSVSGFTSTFCREMKEFSWMGKSAALYVEDCFRPINEVLRMLNERGLQVYGKEAADHILGRMSLVRDFPQADKLDRPGFDGKTYGFLDGDVEAPEGGDKPSTVYRASPGRHSVRGTVQHWKRWPADELNNDALPQMCAMFPFGVVAAEVLGKPMSLAIELVGRAGSSKTEMQLISASVQGSIGSDPIAFKALCDDPAGTLAQYRGTLPLIGDPALALAADPPARRQSSILGVLRELARSDDGPRACFIKGERSLADWAGTDTEVGQLAQKQLITLVIGNERPFGAYDYIDGDGVAAYNLHLKNAVLEAHGVAYREFVGLFVASYLQDKAALTAWFDKHLDAFVCATGVDPHDTINVKKARALGMIYAAGLWARRRSILPGDWNCGRAVRRCWTRHLITPTPRRGAPTILADVAAVALRLDSAPRPTLEAIKEAHAFVRGSGRKRKIFILAGSMDRYPELHARLYEVATKSLLISPDPIESRQRLGPLGLKRVYAFRVPEGESKQED